MKTTQEKEKELDGKRYKIINLSIEKRKASGDEVSHEMEIDLHYAWKKTILQIKDDFNLQ